MRLISAALLCIAIAGLALWLSDPSIPETGEPMHAVTVAATRAGEPALSVLANISELRELEQALRPASPFWSHNAEAEAQRVERIVRAEHDARAALVERFGAQVSRMPLFRQLFRPLHERMPQLNSEQQIMIHDLERRFAAEAMRHESAIVFDDHLTGVRERLGAQVASEYALHASPLADELRTMRVALSAEQFRRSFAALSELHATTDRESFLAARRRLREQLGSREFAQLWSSRDPEFVRIESVAKRFGLTSEQTASAYAMMLENQDAMLSAVFESDSAMPQDRLRQQYEVGRRRLQELIGARAAEALLLAISDPLVRHAGE